MLAKEFAIAGGEDFGGGRGGAESVAEAIDLAAFKVDAGKERRGDAVLAIAQEAEGLLGSFYISREENYASGLEAGEQGA